MEMRPSKRHGRPILTGYRAIAILLIGLIASNPIVASATAFLVSFAGSVHMNDSHGVFGPASNDYVDVPFFATVLIDDAIATADYIYDPAYPDNDYAQSRDDSPSVLTMSLAINDTTIVFQDANIATFLTGYGSFGPSIVASMYEFSNSPYSGELSFFSTNPSLIPPTSYHTPSGPLAIPPGVGGYFSIGTAASGLPSVGQFTLNTITFHGSTTPGVPEPATWIMWFIGFGSIGGVLRWRRQICSKSQSARLLRRAMPMLASAHPAIAMDVR